MASVYLKRLMEKIVAASVSNDWKTAVDEWYIVGCEEDSSLTESCICGKENLRYLFTIRNLFNGNILFPIGSKCIKKFGRNDLSQEVAVWEKMFKLYHAVESGQFITLSSEFFSKKLLLKLYEEGAFNTAYNNYQGEGDLNFMLRMFNTRNKNSITYAQHKKIRAIIVASIRPYLQKKLLYSYRPMNVF